MVEPRTLGRHLAALLLVATMAAAAACTPPAQSGGGGPSTPVGTETPVASGATLPLSLSADGRFLVYAHDGPVASDEVRLADRVAGTDVLVGQGLGEDEPHAMVTPDGSAVFWTQGTSTASFRYDVATGSITSLGPIAVLSTDADGSILAIRRPDAPGIWILDGGDLSQITDPPPPTEDPIPGSDGTLRTRTVEDARLSPDGTRLAIESELETRACCVPGPGLFPVPFGGSTQATLTTYDLDAGTSRLIQSASTTYEDARVVRLLMVSDDGDVVWSTAIHPALISGIFDPIESATYRWREARGNKKQLVEGEGLGASTDGRYVTYLQHDEQIGAPHHSSARMIDTTTGKVLRLHATTSLGAVALSNPSDDGRFVAKVVQSGPTGPYGDLTLWELTG